MSTNWSDRIHYTRPTPTPEETKHASLHWTGCYIQECKFHEQEKVNNRYWPKEPQKTTVRRCRTCGQQGHNSQYCNRYNNPPPPAPSATELPEWVYQPAGSGLGTNRGATEHMDGLSGGPSAPTATMAPSPSQNLPDEGSHSERVGRRQKKGKPTPERTDESSSLSTISPTIFRDYEHIAHPPNTTPIVTFSGDDVKTEP